MLRQIAAGEEISLAYSPSWFVASCRHRFRARKNPGPAVHPQIFAGAPAWVRSGDPHFTISGLLRIGHSAANNRFLAAMPVGTLASTAKMCRKSGTGRGWSRRIGGGVTSCQTTCRRGHWVLITSGRPWRGGSMRRPWATARSPGRGRQLHVCWTSGSWERAWSRRRLPRLPGWACPRRAPGSVPRLIPARSRIPRPSGQCTAGRPRLAAGRRVFPSRDEVHALPAVWAAADDRQQAGATR